MPSRRPRPWPATWLALALLLSACGADEPVDDASQGIANPASQFCVDQGGRVDIVEDEGGQVGICELPDGTRIEEWEYYRANAPSPSPGPSPSPSPSAPPN